MAQVIQGIQGSWDLSIASIRFSQDICATAWSHCSRYIAVTNKKSIVLLDAVTLKQLQKIHLHKQRPLWAYISFSPGSHLLTAYSSRLECIVSWDIQTGGLLSNINIPGYSCNSVSYSECETMIGGSFSNNTILIHNVISGICLSSHPIKEPLVETTWTCGEYLQFATIESGSKSIAMWQVGFTSSHGPTKVASLSTPDNFSLTGLVLLPTLSRLAFTLGGEVIVWDAHHHKVFLHSADVKDPRNMSFSPDGHFFVCGTEGKQLHIWKESPTGYISHQRLVSGVYGTTPLVSPNGESVISSSGKVIHLWHTASSPTSHSNIPKQPNHHSGWFFIEFSSDESFVVIAERLGKKVTVLNTESCNRWLVIYTGTKTCGLKMTEDKIIVVGEGKVVTWDLPARHSVFTRYNIRDSVQTTTFTHSAPIKELCASISPCLNYLALGDKEGGSKVLCISNIHTGEKIAAVESDGSITGFTPSGHVVWYAKEDTRVKVNQWEVVEGNGSNTFQLKELLEDMEPLQGFPWHSPDGYQVTSDGWILCPSGKWLIWLPHHWKPDAKMQRQWSGRFLSVWNKNSLKPCILRLNL